MEAWLGATDEHCQTIGGFLYGTVAAVAAGLTASTVRWLMIDSLHHWTGIRQPEWNLQDLHSRTAAFEVLIEIHYRYYQFYANSLLAMWLAAVAQWTSTRFSWFELVVVLLLTMVFYAGSRDTLRKYYLRVERMLSLGSPA